MIAEFEFWRAGDGTPVTEALRALRFVQATHPTPLLLGVAPFARGNPYQSQLYRSFASEGIAVAPVNDLWSFARLADLLPQAPVAVHLHWLSWILGPASDRSEARSQLHRFADELTALREAGGRLVWTVHNVLPHDTRFPEIETELRHLVSESADVIHMMSPSTIPAVASTARVDPAKAVYAPIPNYRGVYPDSVTSVEARLALGLEPDELVLLVFGALKPYKGLTALLEAFDVARARTSRRMRLLVAGAPDEHPSTREFVDRATVHPDVLLAPRRIPTEHVEYFVRAADVGLATYEGALNSSATMLYETFGLPVVAPDVATLRETLCPDGHLAYVPGDVASLAEALVAAGELATPETSRRVAEHVRRVDAELVSAPFARELRARLGVPG